MAEAHPIAHFVGSIPLDDAETVFRTLATELCGHVERIPDGETGRRRRWISFIADQLRDSDDFEIDESIPPFRFTEWTGKLAYEIARLKFRDGVNPKKVKFNTGYADDAIRNFAIFDRLRKEGVIPAGVKYQICMATPLAIAYNFIVPSAYDAFIEVYMDHLAGEVKRIMEALPHDSISYQWDVCQEVLMWEGYYAEPEPYKEQMLSVLGRIGDLVPADTDLGYHLCYGSPRDVHMIMPRDMAILVEIANGIVGRVHRPVQYIHMPVPQNRTDEAYYSPLKGLKLPKATALYLGLVHPRDAEGNAERLALARKYADVKGIAAECGMGRGDPAKFPAMIEEHRRLVEAG